MSEISGKRPRFRFRVFILEGIVVVLAAIVLLFFFVDSRRPPNRDSQRVACMVNLRTLGSSLLRYADEHSGRYPSAERWCDLLADGYVEAETFRCPAAETGRCNYAMNPHADPNSAGGGVVLLFESRPGWNQYGGPELLTMENHQGQRCAVFLVDGSTWSVKAEDVNGLRWADERAIPSGRAEMRRSRKNE